MKPSISTLVSIFALLSIAAIIATFTASFKGNVPTCKGYIVNTYLYIMLGLLLVSFFILLIAKHRLPITETKRFIAIGIAIVTVVALNFIEPQQVFLSHALWLVFLICIAVSLYVVWRYSHHGNTVKFSLIATIVAFAILTGIVYAFPGIVDLNWGSILFGLVIVLLILWSGPKILGMDVSTRYYKVLSILSTLVFSILVLYDTKTLREKATTCVFPNYPKDSLSLFLDFLQLFANANFMKSLGMV